MFHKVVAGDSLTDIASDLATQITALDGIGTGYEASMQPGLMIGLNGTPAQGADWVADAERRLTHQLHVSRGGDR